MAKKKSKPKPKPKPDPKPVKTGYERHACPECYEPLPARQGWRTVPGAEDWRRRVRECASCGYIRVFIELPEEHLQEFVRTHDTVNAFRVVVTQLQLSDTPAPDLSAELRELLGIPA